MRKTRLFFLFIYKYFVVANVTIYEGVVVKTIT